MSAAEALHGHHHETETYANGHKQESDFAVRTDCLRSGDRCISVFHNPDSARVLVFGDGKWTYGQEFDDPFPGGGTHHVNHTAMFKVPAPAHDPITLLNGHGHLEQTGACHVGSWDLDDKYVRTGE